MCNRYYFAAYSGGECILRCQGENMKVRTPDTTTQETRREITDIATTFNTTVTATENRIYVDYIDDDGKHQQVMLSPNVAWTLEVENGGD